MSARRNLNSLSLVGATTLGRVLFLENIATQLSVLDERSGVSIEPLEVAVVTNPPQGVRKGVAGREARCEDSPPLGRKAGKCSV